MARRPARREERGLTIPLVAMVLTALIAFSSLALDLGYQRVARRDMQALADVVALDLARLVDGRSVAVIEADPGWLLARDQSVARNDSTVGDPPVVTPVLGRVDPDTGAFVEMFGADTPDAVQVTASTSIDYFLRPGSGATQRTAVGSQLPAANFVIGSFLAGTDPDLDIGLLNRLLPRLIGSSLDSLALTAVGYQGLADAQMDLGQLSAELGLGSPDELADVGVFNARDVYLASAEVMEQNGNTAAANVFRTIAFETDSNAEVDFGDVFAQQGGPGSEISGGTNLSMQGLFFLNSTIFSIDGNNLVSVPGFNFGIPGVTSTNLTLEVIEAPQYCKRLGFLCRIGEQATTAQVRVRLENTVQLTNLGLPLTNPTATGTVVTETSGAQATGTLTAARCRSGTATQGIDVGVTTAPITTTASEDLLVGSEVSVLGIATVTDVAHVTIVNQSRLASGTGGTVSFSFPTEFLPTAGTGTMKRVGSPVLGLSSALTANSSNVTVLNLGLGIGGGTIASAVNLALAPTVDGLETFVARRLARTLGLYIGGADVGAVDLQCGGVGLVG